MDKIILCCEVNNCQKGFSALMQIIQALETDKNEVDYLTINNAISMRYCWFKEGTVTQYSARNIVQSIETSWYDSTNENKGVWNVYKLTELKRVVEKKKEYQISYYVRICDHSESDIKNIQYLLLILQQFPMVCGRIQVFWMPFENYMEGTKKEWDKVSAYHRYSHYLRFVLEKYKDTFFSAFYSNREKKVCIEQLSSKKKGIQSTFFPLIEIDSEIHSVFTRYCSLGYEKLLVENEERYKNSKLIDLLEISKRILEKRIEEGLGNKEEREAYTLKVYQRLSIERVMSLEYAVFSALIPIFSQITDDEIDGYMERARSISSGLVQIIENIILHSANHKGVFTFRIIKEGKKFLANILDKEPETRFDRTLEIDIADVNTYETILDNFSKKIKSEDYFDNVKLSVAHFFQKFDSEETEKAWKRFRRDNPVKCLGLERLGVELRLSNALFQVRSSTAYCGESTGLTYKENAYNKVGFKKAESNDFLPGTQFNIWLPILRPENIKQHNANVFVDSIGNLRETDATYAKYINYSLEPYETEETDIECKGIIRRRTILESDFVFDELCKKISTDDNAKDRMVQLWREELNTWEKQFEAEEKKVYFIDLKETQDFRSSWGIETFCKGFVSSNILRSQGQRYIALINCDSKMMQMMFDTIMISENYISKNVQLYLHNANCLDDLVVIGDSKETIIANALQYCYTKGNPPDYLKRYYQSHEKEKYMSDTKWELFPFDVLISQEKGGQTLFEKYIEKVAQNLLIATEEAGYLLSDTHMRLGSKVHLKEFYEISILFRKARISRKIALLIIRRMIEEDVEVNSNLLFYGYASYSKSILTALTEIMRCYQGKKYFVEFVVYQNDIMVQKTLSHINSKVRMYYSQDIPSDMQVNIIQIVPISSTLTTFKKMWDMFVDERQEQSQSCRLIKNYTLFWVRDLPKENFENQPTEREEEYWSEIKEKRTIKTSLIDPDPQFFCKREIQWFNPLNCIQCYPENVLDEMALIETDVTSTVPSQQLEIKMPKQIRKDEDEERIINEIRLINLKDCIYYGHVSRDGNHFQYYIDTIKYFHKQKDYIAKWLGKLQDKRESDSNESVLNILVTPQHHTNVEFAHYVNNYYYNGSAEIITIDSAKEYRTNIVLKYADVKTAIEAAYRLAVKVNFIYVDDSIITGVTYRRVNNLLHSLVPKEIRKPIQFEKVFVLVNRLSTFSKMDYVNDVGKDFHTFVELKISSVRNFGDSCAMCTLQKNSKLFFKRASTTEISRYWNKKRYDYEPITFDKYSQLHDFETKKEQGYLRMLSSHYAREKLNIGSDIKDAILSIVTLFSEIEKNQEVNGREREVIAIEENMEYFKSEKLSPIYCRVFKKDITKTIKSYLKILCRPFFSYGKFYRQAILDIFLVLTESFLNPKFDSKLMEKDSIISTNKGYLNDYDLKSGLLKLCQYFKDMFPEGEQRVTFIQDYLMEGLTDLKSNYILRINTMNFFRVMIVDMPKGEDYYRTYIRMIHRLINSNADETKSLWLEYLLITGKENDSNLNDISSINVYESDKDDKFQSFVDSIFIENTRLYYDSMLNFVKYAKTVGEKEKISEEEQISKAVIAMWDDYYIRNLRKFVKLEILADCTTGEKDEEKINSQIKLKVKKMAHLLYVLKNEKAGGIERYTKLKKCIEELLYEGDKLQILTSAFEGAKDSEELYAVADNNNGSVARKIGLRVKEAMKSVSLKNKSFYIGQNYIILSIDNNEKYLRGKGIEDGSLTKIQPLYFYIECDTDKHFHVKLRIRKILMYRYQLLHWIEADFNNNTMPVLAEQMGINRQLMRERAGDHNSSADILATEKLLQSKYRDEHQEVYRWLLLKVYVNMRIARLFRCEWSNSYEEVKDKAYTKIENADAVNGALKNIGNAIWGGYIKRLKSKKVFFIYKRYVLL